MKIQLVIAAVLLVVLGCTAYYFYGGTATPNGQAPLISLTSRNFPALKTAFNHDDQAVRVIVMLSPT